MMNTTTMVKVPCGKCSGSGRYYFQTGHGTCFPCNGVGTVLMSAAKLAKMREQAAASQARYEAEIAREGREGDAQVAAEALIDARGITGAREFFAAHRTDVDALAGLIYAMRNAGLHDAANALVRHRNEMVATAVAP